MINSCPIDILNDDFPWLLMVPADESPVDMESVLAFYDRCFPAGCDRTAVASSIRAYVEAKSGMKQTFLPVIRRL